MHYLHSLHATLNAATTRQRGMPRPFTKIVTVETMARTMRALDPVLRQAPARKTALAPPAVRAPVFPHAIPVNGRLEARDPQVAPTVKSSTQNDLIRKCPFVPTVLSQECLHVV